MSVFLCKRLLRVHIFHTPLLRALSATTVTSIPPPSSSSSSFTVDFLTTSCGLTPAQALSAARTLHLDEKSRGQPESVLAVLHSYGFTDAQIAELVARSPRILLCRAQKKLGPKLQFLIHAGFSTAMIAPHPGVLHRSLDGHIRPCFEFLHCFIGSAQDVRTMLRRHKWFLNFDMKSSMIRNVELLLELGVAAPAISRLMMTHPRSLMKSHERFVEILQIVQDWGLKPDKNLFLHAVRAVCGLGKSTLAARLELFKNLGWSEEQVILAFQRCPLFILVSEQKVVCMDTFARKLGLGPADLSRQPKLLMYGFDKRILPRYSVWHILSSKGLIKKSTKKLISMFTTSEKPFLERYVVRHMDEIPQLMDVFLGKIKVEGLDLGGEENSSKQKL